jgi:hypothetical protein
MIEVCEARGDGAIRTFLFFAALVIGRTFYARLGGLQ